MSDDESTKVTITLRTIVTGPEAGCIIGVDYPSPIVVHKEASKRNRELMEELQGTLMKKCNMEVPKHIKPSDEAEIKVFFGLTKNES